MTLMELIETMPKVQKVYIKWPFEKNPYAKALEYRGSIGNYLATKGPDDVLDNVKVRQVRHKRGKIVAILMEKSPATIFEEETP